MSFTLDRQSIQSIKLEGLGFCYQNAEPLFKDISVELPKARAVWLQAPGGGGKSTLLKMLAGMISPTAGRILFNGVDVTTMSFEEFLPYRLNLGYGFDMGGLINNKTLFENLLLPLLYHKMCSVEEAHARVNQLLETFALSRIRDQRPFAVSGSQRKLVCALRALVHQPEIVFLDDVATGLKADSLNDFIHYVDESFGSRGLRQVFFTSEGPELSEHWKAEHFLISQDWFTTRAVA